MSHGFVAKGGSILKSQASAQGAAKNGSCVHFWRVEAPNGPTSKGTCKHCGAVEEFKNSIPTTGWQRSTPETRRKAAEARQRAAQ